MHSKIASAFFFLSEAFLLALKITMLLLAFSFSLHELLLSQVSLNLLGRETDDLQVQHFIFVPLNFTLSFAAQHRKICVGSQFYRPPSALSHCLSQSSVCCQNHGCCWVVGESQLRSLSWENAIVSIACLEWTGQGGAPQQGLRWGPGKGSNSESEGRKQRGKVFDESKFYLLHRSV